MGTEFTEAELEKKVKKIGRVEIKEEERMFLALGKKFRIENRKWKKEEVLMDAEDIIYSEREEEEDRNNIRRKVIPIVERANRDRKDNLMEKERRGMRGIKKRKDIVKQPADKGGGIAVMGKE